ncbi:oxygenase MpaB family protein [Paenarthrobacter sp. GOM3]|uniref:oxygenase MpaB family protein n=1 Tax=Paenarthrobacter sp. GOM3 TaxID=2782567 RepID=UPI001BA508BD|nr:oxygenase MpaB family protein [Paenarthrobacter sp. GOM3]WOH19287.1 oxygenase MpaB family protein [Paenarthrobacter sp. GOM3]
MRNYLTEYRHELQRTFTGTSGTPPEWVPRLAEGNDAGYHLPGSAAWAVHGHVATIVAGIRVLLMQALHPGALAGVYEHSGFQKDPLGRLANTVRWIFTVTYGSTDAAEAATARVRKIHERVRGTYVDGQGVEREYAANNPELLRWVHVTYADSFITANRIWGRPIPGGPDAYVREWAAAGRLMGVIDPPLTWAQVREELEAWYSSGVLRADERLAETVSFIRRPPLSPLLRPGYRILFAAAVATLEPKYRDLLGLRRAKLGLVPVPVVTAARAVLGMVRFALGSHGPSEQAARRRLQRLGYAA